MGMTEMLPIELATGARLPGDPILAKQLGILVRGVVMERVVFGLAHQGSRR